MAFHARCGVMGACFQSFRVYNTEHNTGYRWRNLTTICGEIIRHFDWLKCLISWEGRTKRRCPKLGSLLLIISNWPHIFHTLQLFLSCFFAMVTWYIIYYHKLIIQSFYHLYLTSYWVFSDFVMISKNSKFFWLQAFACISLSLFFVAVKYQSTSPVHFLHFSFSDFLAPQHFLLHLNSPWSFTSRPRMNLGAPLSSVFLWVSPKLFWTGTSWLPVPEVLLCGQ